MLMHHCSTTNVLYFLIFTVCINVPADSMMIGNYLFIYSFRILNPKERKEEVD